MHAMRMRIFFPEQECNLVTGTKSYSLVTEKNCVKCTCECLELLLIAMLITGHNNEHDVSGCRQSIHKL